MRWFLAAAMTVLMMTLVTASSRLPDETPEQPGGEKAEQSVSLPSPAATPRPTPTLRPTSTLNPTPTPSASAVPAVPATPAVTPEPQREWSYDKDGVSVKIARHEREGFVYFAADIQLARPDQFSYAFSHEEYGAGTEVLSDIAARHDPVLAINGDFYGFHGNGIIIRGGELFRKQNSTRHLLIVDAKGDLSVLTDRREKQGVVADGLMDQGVLHTFEFGPALVRNGKATRLNFSLVRSGEGYLEPRTAIGQLGPLHYLVIVVDGRSEGYSAGCDLPTLQRLFLEYGVSIAFNLDGGGSTTLWFDGAVINQPASGEERKVSDIVMFMK